MNKTYRLQTLLKIREQKKLEAERYLMECNRLLKQERERQTELEEELQRMIAKREEHTRQYAEKAMAGGLQARSAISANHYTERLRELEEAQAQAIESQKKVVKRREEDVHGAQKDLRIATQDLKALEKHREKWEARVRKHQAAQEEKSMDEVAQNLFLRQTRNAKPK